MFVGLHLPVKVELKNGCSIDSIIYNVSCSFQSHTKISVFCPESEKTFHKWTET
jgi:hypothetical protein